MDRITVEARKMGGQPGIRGPVAIVVAMTAVGLSADEIVMGLPDLVAEDVVEALGCDASR